MSSPMEPVELHSPEIALVPLRVEHAAALLRHVDAATWRGMTSPRPRSVADARRYVLSLTGQPDVLAFAVLDAGTGEVRGSTAFYDYERRHGRVEIGYTFYGRPHWGGGTNPWCKLLLLQHAFESWGVHRVALRCDVRNERSIGAIERLGAVREGVLRGHRLAGDGVRSDTMYFSIVAPEWPAVQRRLQARVALSDPTGR